MIIAILFWYKMPVHLTDTLLGKTIYPKIQSPNFEHGAGVRIFGILYSTFMIWPASLAWLLVIFGFIVSYFRYKPLISYEPLNRARYLWLTSFSLIFIWLLPLSIPFVNFQFSFLIVAIASLLIGLIPLLYPQGLLLTFNQLEPILPLFENIEKSNKTLNRQQKDVMDYLELVEKNHPDKSNDSAL